MVHNDALSSMISSIKNAHQASLVEVIIPYSTTCVRVLNVLYEEGYLRGYKFILTPENKPALLILLKYTANTACIKDIRRISLPGRRIYSQIGQLPVPKNGLGLFVLSTSKGVISDTKARSLGIGGEILCLVF